MLAKRPLPPEFHRWNHHWGAPFGRHVRAGRLLRRRVPLSVLLKLSGPFSVQENNDCRSWEYPWAFHAVPVGPSSNVIDLGGGCSGFPFALASTGARVTNVDPCLDPRWVCPSTTIDTMNQVFRTEVQLARSTLAEARLPSESVDTIYSLSVLEHLDPEELQATVDAAVRVLKPGGYLVLTVDLFLNLYPFCTRERNEWGTNYRVTEFLRPKLRLIQGERSQLYGFPEFTADEILAHNEEFFLASGARCFSQCLVLQKF